MIADDTHAAVVAALATGHRHELSAKVALCAVYRALLEEAGIPAPDDADGAEALRRYRIAFALAGELDPEQPRELTSDWWWAAHGRSLGTVAADLGIPDVWPAVGFPDRMPA